MKRAALSDMQIRRAKPGEKNYKLTDGEGLYLVVTPAGGKLWRLDYTFSKKRKTLSLGQYPALSLTEARDAKIAAKNLLLKNIDPGVAKKDQRGGQVLFRDMAMDWYNEMLPEWSQRHADRLLRRMELDLFPFLGDKPIATITAEDIETTLKRVAMRSVDTAHRIKAALRGILNLAIRRGYLNVNYVESMRGVIPSNKHTHHAAPTEPKKVGELMRAIDAYEGSMVVSCAVQLAPRLFVRPDNLRKMEWCEIDFERKIWSIPAEKMKMKDPHLVPLSDQCMTILQSIYPITGHWKYVFQGRIGADKPISDMAVNAALRRMGFDKSEITGHGFRAMARTMLDEVLRFNPDAIEAQLAHRVPDRLGRAYNRTRHLDERVRMMQEWADYLDRLKSIAK